MDTNKDLSGPGPENENYRSRHRHSGHNKRKRPWYRQAFRWIRKNPNKAIAIILGIVLIFITYLFIQFAIEHPTRKHISLYELRTDGQIHKQIVNSALSTQV